MGHLTCWSTSGSRKASVRRATRRLPRWCSQRAARFPRGPSAPNADTFPSLSPHPPGPSPPSAAHPGARPHPLLGGRSACPVPPPSVVPANIRAVTTGAPGWTPAHPREHQAPRRADPAGTRAATASSPTHRAPSLGHWGVRMRTMPAPRPVAVAMVTGAPAAPPPAPPPGGPGRDPEWGEGFQEQLSEAGKK
ncbi:testis development-related protein isoform X1 [Bos javanicus]|uniref:testis development-related protein isoform X1 n=1 Tax=Bos javanicus TaxID=9906 RepID=UPI002AA7554B|nr:testis development-related protein isoform X1 [Bos javanicus]